MTVPKFLQPNPITDGTIREFCCNCDNHQFDEIEKTDDYPCLSCLDKCEDQEDKDTCISLLRWKMEDARRKVEAANNNSLRKELGIWDED